MAIDWNRKKKTWPHGRLCNRTGASVGVRRISAPRHFMVFTFSPDIFLDWIIGLQKWGDVIHLGMDQYLLIAFLVGWTSINPSYFDVNYRGTRVLTHCHFIIQRRISRDFIHFSSSSCWCNLYNLDNCVTVKNVSQLFQLRFKMFKGLSAQGTLAGRWSACSLETASLGAFRIGNPMGRTNQMVSHSLWNVKWIIIWSIWNPKWVIIWCIYEILDGLNIIWRI